MALAELPASHEELFAVLARKYAVLPRECRRDFINKTLALYHSELERQHPSWTAHERGKIFYSFTMTLLDRLGLKIEGRDVMH